MAFANGEATDDIPQKGQFAEPARIYSARDRLVLQIRLGLPLVVGFVLGYEVLTAGVFTEIKYETAALKLILKIRDYVNVNK